MSLRTGRLLSRRRWTALPMPREVIARVNHMGKVDGQPEILSFYDRKGNLLPDAEIAGVEPDITGVDDATMQQMTMTTILLMI